MNYKNEFPDFEMPNIKIPEGFTDESWHNDSMPHFEKILNPNTGKRYELWINYPPEQSEVPNFPRFMLYLINDKNHYIDEAAEYHATNTIEEFNEIIKELNL